MYPIKLVKVIRKIELFLEVRNINPLHTKDVESYLSALPNIDGYNMIGTYRSLVRPIYISLDYINNFLSVQAFAAHPNMESVKDAENAINYGSDIIKNILIIEKK